MPNPSLGLESNKTGIMLGLKQNLSILKFHKQYEYLKIKYYFYA